MKPVHETLEAAPEGVADEPVRPRVVLFDFDGVLHRGDAFHLFLRERYSRSSWRKLLALLSSPWLLLGLAFSWRVPMRTLTHIALLGLDERRYRAIAETFAGELARKPRQFIRDGLQVLRRHQAAGDRVIVVSGCEAVLLGGVLEQLGLRDIEVVASRLRPGWFGMRLRLHNIGQRKVQSLAAQGIAAWQLAYGDSVHDIPMLKQAREAVLVNGTPKLCKKVEKALGRTISRAEWF